MTPDTVGSKETTKHSGKPLSLGFNPLVFVALLMTTTSKSLGPTWPRL